jgi:hypothetical protein
MHQVHVELSDQLYDEAERRANAAGFAGVSEYVSDVLLHDLNEETEAFERLFTPERLAHIDKAIGKVNAGEFYTSEQVSDYFDRKYRES